LDNALDEDEEEESCGFGERKKERSQFHHAEKENGFDILGGAEWSGAYFRAEIRKVDSGRVGWT